MLSHDHSNRIQKDLSDWLDQGIISMSDMVAYGDILKAAHIFLLDEDQQRRALELHRRYTEAQHGN